MLVSEAWSSMDRSHFVPPVIWIPTESGYRAVSREADPDSWQEAVAADQPVVTQVDDGSTAAARPGQRASSSSSQPSLVRAMLEAAEIATGMTVLEIGTGTGWTAALLAQRLGSDRVTTVEVDPEVAEQARIALAVVGCSPTVIVGDGADGHPGRAPYDRVLATCAVTTVPPPWVAQTRAGGMILTPWGTDYHNGALARLTVDNDGAAQGPFTPMMPAFMRLRSQRTATCPWDGDGPGRPTLSSTTLASEEIYEMVVPPGAFAIGLRLDRCHKLVDEENLVVRLHDPDSGSWARCTVTPGAAGHPVAEHGPRALWREAEAARTWWVECGRPAPTRFGLTIGSTGQEVWLDEAANMIAPAR